MMIFYELFFKNGGLSDEVCFSELKYCSIQPVLQEIGSNDVESAELPGREKTETQKKEKRGKKKKRAEKTTPLEKSNERVAAKLETLAARRDGPAIDLKTFMHRFAVRNNLVPDAYLGAKPEHEWEKVIVAMAGILFDQRRQEL